MAWRKSDNSPVRWMRIVTRTVHLMAISLVVGAVWFRVQPPLWAWVTAVGSGSSLLGLFFYQNPRWLLEHRGLVILVKLFLLVQLSWLGSSSRYVLLLILAISALISHAPGSLRYGSFFIRPGSK